jgi:hypothetical protein
LPSYSNNISTAAAQAELTSRGRVLTDLAEDVGVANDDEQSLGAGDGHVEPIRAKKYLQNFFHCLFPLSFSAFSSSFSLTNKRFLGNRENTKDGMTGSQTTVCISYP